LPPEIGEMLFSSLTFLYVFLPLVILLTLLTPRKWHNSILLLASLVFYAWGGVSYSLIMLTSIGLNYFFGLKIHRHQSTGKAKQYLFAGIGLNLLILIIFKYSNFLIDNFNTLGTLFKLSPIEIESIALPLGISFFTFQAMSYLIDLYRKEAKVQKRLDKLALYISLFPQLVAGPIVRYHDIAEQIENRQIKLNRFSSGIERFLLGLAKKVLIADAMAPIADDIFAIQEGNLSTPVAWVGVIAYALQIYFDFSGYSDMAIGLGRTFGFEIRENFNFPYISKSIREFWRRWHISLSEWFRDYLYIPLGGNRISIKRTYLNLLIVFFLTGLWHGASWNFVVWGLFHGFFLIVERFLDKSLQRSWTWPLAHLYTLLVVLFGWVFFRANDLSHALYYSAAMLSVQEIPAFEFNLSAYWNPEILAISGIAILACTPVFKNIHQKTTSWLAGSITRIQIGHFYDLITVITLMSIFVFCTMKLLTDTYSPFIYFRF
jgi:alginate O-acetyltransferase complex protein AlgI